MSHQTISSNLVVDLTTTEQEILTGGCNKLVASEENQEPENKDDDDKEDNEGRRYNFLIYRPFLYRPDYFVKA